MTQPIEPDHVGIKVCPTCERKIPGDWQACIEHECRICKEPMPMAVVICDECWPRVSHVA